MAEWTFSVFLNCPKSSDILARHSLSTKFVYRALGLQDESGNIYEMLEYTFFNHSDMGIWEKMSNGMVNVSFI